MSLRREEVKEVKTRTALICNVCNEEIDHKGGSPVYGPSLKCGCGEGYWYVKDHYDAFYVPWETPERFAYDEQGRHSFASKWYDERIQSSAPTAKKEDEG